jgi:hypothetical protein
MTYISVVMLNGFPCHHGMVHPEVANGEESLKIWKIAANM